MLIWQDKANELLHRYCWEPEFSTQERVNTKMKCITLDFQSVGTLNWQYQKELAICIYVYIYTHAYSESRTFSCAMNKNMLKEKWGHIKKHRIQFETSHWQNV